MSTRERYFFLIRFILMLTSEDTNFSDVEKIFFKFSNLSKTKYECKYYEDTNETK